nr:immunoglobulin heavy chain junction region [Mus musculus]
CARKYGNYAYFDYW